MKQHFTKIACGFTAATLAFALAACDDSSSASGLNGFDSEDISSESNGGDNPEFSSDSGNGSENIESSDNVESSDSVESSDAAESSAANGSSSSTESSSASLNDNSSSSMAVTCQALTLECYSAQQLCNRGMTEYCVNSSSSTETCQHVSDVDGGSCRDGDVVKDCATDAYASCSNNKWTLAIIGDRCETRGKEMTINAMVLKCENNYWQFDHIIGCPTGGNNSCRPPRDCYDHPLHGFSCNEADSNTSWLRVDLGGVSCDYQCMNGTYQILVPVPVGN